MHTTPNKRAMPPIRDGRSFMQTCSQHEKETRMIIIIVNNAAENLVFGFGLSSFYRSSE